MKENILMKRLLVKFKRILLNPYLIMIAAVLAFTANTYLEMYKNAQSHKISRFEKDFIDPNKDGETVFNEGLVMVGSAKTPIRCLATMRAVFGFAKHELDTRKKVLNPCDVISAAHDRILEDCK